MNPKEELDRIVCEAFPQLRGLPRTAEVLNSALGTSFNDSDDITWETVKIVREAIAKRNA